MSEADVNKLTSKDRRGSLAEVGLRATYLEHVKKNPTKNFSEAVLHLYQELDNLGAFVSEGITDNDFDSIKDIYGKTVNRSSENDFRFDLLIKHLVEKREKRAIPETHVLCFATSPDNNQFLLQPIPKRDAQG